jgi:hypothetical protein
VSAGSAEQSGSYVALGKHDRRAAVLSESKTAFMILQSAVRIIRTNFAPFQLSDDSQATGQGAQLTCDGVAVLGRYGQPP